MSFARWRSSALDDDLRSDIGPAMADGAILVAGSARIRIVSGQATLTTGQRLTAGAAHIEVAGGLASTTAHPVDDAPMAQSFDVPTTPVADSAQKADIPSMSNDLSREELSAELRAVDSRMGAMEARMDARFAELRADLAILPTKGNLFQYTATSGALVFAAVAIFVSVLAWRQDQFISISDKATSATQLPPPNIIINVPPLGAAPAQPAPAQPAKP